MSLIERRVQAIRRVLLMVDGADFDLIVRERADGPTATLVARSIAKALPDDDRGAVAFTAEELHCLTCAMAGNFPDRFAPIRMDVLRKLARASRDAGGQ